VPFPSVLDTGSVLYELKSVVVHIGSHLNNGHFVAIIRIKERWILANDSELTVLRNDEVEEFFAVGEGKHVCSTTAFLLFYEKVG
jgi:uncharacterized UBP type Zn finger protein